MLTFGAKGNKQINFLNKNVIRYTVPLKISFACGKNSTDNFSYSILATLRRSFAFVECIEKAKREKGKATNTSEIYTKLKPSKYAKTQCKTSNQQQ